MNFNERVRQLFDQALALAPGDRPAFIESASADDARLCSSVLLLLGAAQESADLEAGAFDFARFEWPDRPAAGSATAKLASEHAIDGYILGRVLAHGGQGVVYQAIQESTHRRVAIKVLLPQPTAAVPQARRFDREIDLIAELQHPSIVTIFDSGRTADGRRFYVMDYIDGLPLDEFVRRQQLALHQVLRLVSRVCSAVQYAHQRGIIHRDLKPSNILIDESGAPRLLDFGLAKRAAPIDDSLISIGREAVGTIPYMSPEQTGNGGEVDTRSDVYSLGVLLYRLLTGRYPYPVDGSVLAAIKHITTTPPMALRQAWTPEAGIVRRLRGKAPRRGCPIDDEVQTIVLRALAKEPPRRYQSPGELGRDIEHYLAGEPIEAKRDRPWYLVIKTVQRHRRAVAVMVAAMMLLAAGTLYARQQSALRRREAQLHDRLTRSEQLVTEGISREQARWSEAYIKYEEALDLNPDNYMALCYAGRWKWKEYFSRPYTYRDTGLLEESLVLLDRALELKPQSHAAWNIRSIVLTALGDLAEAEQSCLRTLELKPDYFYAASNLAKIYALQGRYDDALERARLGAEMITADPDRRKYDDGVWLTLGTLQLLFEDPAALESLQTAKRIDIKDSRNRLMLARLYLLHPDYQDPVAALDEAKDAYAFAMDIRDDPRFSRVLAAAYLANEQYEDAQRYAALAIEGGDEPSYGHLIMAIAEAHRQNPTNAGQHLREAQDAWPAGFAEDDVVVTAEKGVLWFDTAQELEGLESQATQLIIE